MKQQTNLNLPRDKLRSHANLFRDKGKDCCRFGFDSGQKKEQAVSRTVYPVIT